MTAAVIALHTGNRTDALDTAWTAFQDASAAWEADPNVRTWQRREAAWHAWRDLFCPDGGDAA